MKRSTTWGKILRIIIAAIFWVAVWETAALIVNKEVLVADPLTVVRRLAAMAVTSEFWAETGLSLLRILIGFLAAVIFGVLAAALTAKAETANILFAPLVTVIRATPVASFIILALVWLQKGQIPTFTAFLIAMPIIWANVHRGIKETDPKLLEVARVYEMPWHRRLGKIYVPSVIPYFSSAAATALGMAWKAGIAAEVLTTPNGSIGKELHSAKVYLETADVFAWTLVVIILSFIIEKLFAYLIRKAVKVHGAKA